MNSSQELRHQGSGPRPHIAVRQFEPGFGKCGFKLFRVIPEALRDLPDSPGPL